MLPLVSGHEARETLLCIMHEWRGTPHRAGQCAPGWGVDCGRFVVSVLDDLYAALAPNDLDRVEAPPRRAQDAGVHEPGADLMAALWGLRRYPSLRVLIGPRSTYDQCLVAARRVRAGDVLFMGAGRARNHIAIAGAEPWSVWHCEVRAGVTRASLGDHALVRSIQRVYRPLRREVARG